MRADRKGRPYFLCAVCGARTFLRGAASLKGPSLLWKPLAAALMNNDADAANVILQNSGKMSDEQSANSRT
jgi:hypothetical protein